MRTLPDLLRPGLEVVFVGINPGEASARAGHYYAHPGNAFWRELDASGLIEGGASTLTPRDDRTLISRGVGFTDVVKRVVTASAQVTSAELLAGVPAFRARLAYASPRAVCFTSTRALQAVLPGARSAHSWGRQAGVVAGAVPWLMPSTSGRAAAYRGEVGRVLRELAAELHRESSERAA